jgi:sugar-specific transcriptional regulator TrmB
MNDTSFNELLESLGLTEYESRTLSTLFRLQESEAPEISRFSQVPKTRVYDVLDKLVGRNLVIEIRGRPKRYRVLDARTVLSSLVENKKREIKAIEEKAFEFAEALADLKKTRLPAGTETVMKVRDARDFERILSQEIEKAQNNVVAFAEITDKHKVLAEAIAKVREKNVAVKMVNAFPNAIIRKNIKETRHLEHGLNAFIIDGKKVVIALSDFKRQMPEYHFAIWQDNKPMANVLQSYFNQVWKKAK